MPPAPAKTLRPVVLVCGEDEFAVKQRAREISQQWSAEGGGFGDDTIDASVNNGGSTVPPPTRLENASVHIAPALGSSAGRSDVGTGVGFGGVAAVGEAVGVRGPTSEAGAERAGGVFATLFQPADEMLCRLPYCEALVADRVPLLGQLATLQ